MSTAVYEGEIVLRDGTKVYFRPLLISDEEKLLTFFRSLSGTSKWLRFFSQVKDQFLITEAHREAQVDTINSFGLIAMRSQSPDAPIIGQAFYTRKVDNHAETAFTVADDCQGLGLGTGLLLRLACIAAEKGIRVFEADVLPVNRAMLDVFYHSGFTVSSHIETGQLHIEFPITICNPKEIAPEQAALTKQQSSL
jgi:acetyltransferase